MDRKTSMEYQTRSQRTAMGVRCHYRWCRSQGIGVGIAIAHAGIESLLIVDRETVGHSFFHGPMKRVSSHHHSQVTQ